MIHIKSIITISIIFLHTLYAGDDIKEALLRYQNKELFLKYQNIDIEKINTILWGSDSYCYSCNDCLFRLYRTKDGGRTWEKAVLTKKELNILGIDYSDLENEEEKLISVAENLTDTSKIFFINDKAGFALFMWPQIDGEWKTIDGGKSWKVVRDEENTPIAIIDNEDFYSFDSSTTVVWNRIFNETVSYITKDGGISWQKCGVAKQSEIAYIESPAYFYDDNNGFIIIKYYHEKKHSFEYALAKTEDKGCNWKIRYTFDKDITPFEIAMANEKEILIIGKIKDYRGFFYSKDSGESFEFICIPLKGACRSYCENIVKCYVLEYLREIDEYYMYVSEDGLKSWIKLTDEEILKQDFCKGNKVLWQSGHFFQILTRAESKK